MKVNEAGVRGMKEKNVFGQMNFWRGHVIDLLKETPEDDLLIIPEGFSNNLLWNAGHILIVYDQHLMQLEEKYYHLFSSGTSPNDWPSNHLDIQAILEKLEQQADLIAKKFAGRLQEKQNEQTIEELLNFMINHECYHYGVMRSLKKVINNR